MKKLLGTIALFSLSVCVGTTAVEAQSQGEQKDTTGTIGFSSPTSGGLTLKEVAELDFGSHAISASDEVYQTTKDTKTTVQDIRGTLQGWSLKVSEKNQFKNGNAELSNAQIILESPSLDAQSTATAKPKNHVVLSPDGSAVEVMSAEQGEGNGTAIEDFAKGSVALSVPGETVKVSGQYTTTLLWTLEEVVPNP